MERNQVSNNLPAPPAPPFHPGPVSDVPSSRPGLLLAWIKAAVALGLLWLVAGCVNYGTMMIGYRSAQSQNGDAYAEIDGGGKPTLTVPLTGGK